MVKIHTPARPNPKALEPLLDEEAEQQRLANIDKQLEKERKQKEKWNRSVTKQALEGKGV